MRVHARLSRCASLLGTPVLAMSTVVTAGQANATASPVCVVGSRGCPTVPRSPRWTRRSRSASRARIPASATDRADKRRDRQHDDAASLLVGRLRQCAPLSRGDPAAPVAVDVTAWSGSPPTRRPRGHRADAGKSEGRSGGARHCARPGTADEHARHAGVIQCRHMFARTRGQMVPNGLRKPTCAARPQQVLHQPIR